MFDHKRMIASDPSSPNYRFSSKALLRQSGGFEGFVAGHVLIHTHQLPFAQGVDLVTAGVDFGPTRSTASPHMESDDHAVPGVNEFLRLRFIVVPRLLPPLNVGADGVAPRDGGSSAGL